MGGTDNENKDTAGKKEYHKIIKDRLFKYTREAGITQDELAKRLGVSSTTVSRWVTHETSTPPVYQLQNVAHILGITVDALLSGRDISVDRDLCATYSKAFLSIIELSDKGLIPPNSYDPFLEYLLHKRIEISNMQMVSEEKKDAWLDRVLQDYNRPLLSPYLTQFIDLFQFVYREIDEYDTYLSIFNLMQGYEDGTTKEEVDALIKKWYDDILMNKGKFKYVSVPYGGTMYALDKDGKAYVTEKPKYKEDVPVSVDRNEYISIDRDDNLFED